ncbi:hypothetical protein V490_05424 [Pseudogymnoascus sp. VKM F-3557]|nr:hypothetical protein V490_05424 [Pseudogymnoascus sp. VKM F-3557]
MVDYRRYLDYPGGRLVYDMMTNRSQGWRDRYLRAEILPPGWKMGISRLGRTPFYDPLLVQEPVERLPVLPRRPRGPRYQATDPIYDDLDQQNPRLYPEHADLVQRQGPSSAAISDRFDDRLRDELYVDSDDDYIPRTARIRRPIPDRLHDDIVAGPRFTSHDLDVIHHNPHLQHLRDDLRQEALRPAIHDRPHRNHVHHHGHHHGHHGHHDHRGHRHPRGPRHVHFADDLDDDLDWRNPFERRRMPYRFVEEELDYPYDEILYSDDELDLHHRYAAHERLLMAPRERGIRERWWELDDD